MGGERELVVGNKSLGNFRLDGIPDAPRGVPQIQVIFDIDVDGRLSVQAREKETGVEQSVTIQGASTENEVTEMLEDAEKYASVDKEKRGNIDLKNQAEALCFEVEKEFSLLKNNLSEDKQQNISELIEVIKQTIQNEDYKLLELKVEELKQVIQDFTL